MLLLSSLVTFGAYYVFDNPSALHDQLKLSFHGSCSSDTFELYFNLFYTVCSVPNVLLPAFGGYYVDKIGMRLMVVIYAFIVLVGQIVVSIGVSTRSIQLVLLGRFLFGLGGESLTVGTSALVSAWFVNQELVLPRQFAMLTSQPLSDWFLYAFAMGFNIAVSRLGSVVNYIVSPTLAASSQVSSAFWAGTGV